MPPPLLLLLLAAALVVATLRLSLDGKLRSSDLDFLPFFLPLRLVGSTQLLLLLTMVGASTSAPDATQAELECAAAAAIKVDVSSPRSNAAGLPLPRGWLLLPLLPLLLRLEQRLLLLRWQEEEGASLRSPGLELSVVVLDVSISSLTEDWVDIFGLVSSAAAAAASCSKWAEEEERPVFLLPGDRDLTFAVPPLLLVVLLPRVLATTDGDDDSADCCC